MARGYKRLTRKARHIIRNLKHTKHASVQNQMIHELRHEVSRTHGFRGPGKAPDLGKAGRWRPLTRKAKQILARLRKAKVWSVQKRLVTELAKEIEHGKRVADRAKQAAKRAQARAKAAARRTRAGAQRTRRAGSRFRKAANQGQERLLTRAERKQGEREKNMPRQSSRQPYAGPFSSRRAHRRWGRAKARREVPGLFTRFAQRRGRKQRSPEQKAWTYRAQAAENRAVRRAATRQSRPPRSPGLRSRRAAQAKAAPARTPKAKAPARASR